MTDEEPRVVKQLGDQDVWVLGKAMVIMPHVEDHWPDELKQALDRRMRANITLRW